MVLKAVSFSFSVDLKIADCSFFLSTYLAIQQPPSYSLDDFLLNLVIQTEMVFENFSNLQ